jgi:small ligand-binding sensory domain FIST
MQPFVVGHATHPQWAGALALVAAQIDAQLDAQRGPQRTAPSPTLGLAYFTDHYAPHAEALLAELGQRWPGVQWAGTVGVGVCASGVEYFDEPALVAMLLPLPAESFAVFSGAKRWPGSAEDKVMHTALAHADSQAPDLVDLISTLADRTAGGYVFGGLAASRTRSCQIANGVFEGGLSGVGFSRDVPIVSRVTQGCQPVSPVRRVTACDRNVVISLDDEPAMQRLLDDLRIRLDQPREAMLSLRSTLVGLSDAPSAGAAPRFHKAFGDDVRVRHLIGLDPGRQGVAVAEIVQPGMQLAFCQRDTEAARRDLVRICAEIRDELAGDGDGDGDIDPTQRIAGAIYVSCAGRGGPHFGAPSAELQIVRHALGDVPLVGFFAGGEIAHRHVYGYTGVLTVFVRHA